MEEVLTTSAEEKEEVLFDEGDIGEIFIDDSCRFKESLILSFKRSFFGLVRASHKMESTLSKVGDRSWTNLKVNSFNEGIPINKRNAPVNRAIEPIADFSDFKAPKILSGKMYEFTIKETARIPTFKS